MKGPPIPALPGFVPEFIRPTAGNQDHRLPIGPSPFSFCFAALLTCLLSLPAMAGLTRTQTIQLNEGWNAVFLEVNPPDSDPAKVFADTPVDIAAAYFEPVSAAQYVIDPGANLFSETGWGVWYAEDRPDAFLKSLYSIFGQQGYLIHARQSFTWQVTGEVLPANVQWQADSYNLAGFSVDSLQAPTFAQFFSGSSVHRLDRIYRLQEGTWKRVANPHSETIRAGEAFWVYCDGQSKYQGPLKVETSTRHGLLLQKEASDLVLRNQTGFPIQATLQHVTDGESAVPLSIVVQAIETPGGPVRSVSAAKPQTAWEQALPPVEAGAAIKIPFQCRSDDMTQYQQTSLLKITTDVGTVHWIPVHGFRPDLKDE